MIPWFPGADPFFVAICSDLYAPGPWLVYADWLDERGESGAAAWCRYLFPNGA
jgi:uncharacterized protein (TIGR02996 family)